MKRVYIILKSIGLFVGINGDIANAKNAKKFDSEAAALKEIGSANGCQIIEFLTR